ncbi:TPA: DNA-binding protein [Acinetobacter baumannii]|nr:DNA-binding protein [Acinetobacter baumannii]HCW4256998.1 DNA-binding protein [Acinetobacter baumannii]HCW4268731.1 DNA-binding protein [Acinetobacter baumannii]HCW4275940.1 DNA-binding protein [Acinetobacter baumannii]
MIFKDSTRRLSSTKSTKYFSFIMANEEQKFPQEVVALYLDCSPWTLARMRCDQSSLPFSKIGRRVSYKKKDVLKYEQSKTVLNTAQLATV